MKTDNSVKITLIIVLGVLIVAVLGFYAFANLTGQRETVQSNGLSQITVMPDLVSVYFNVETNGTTAKEAKDENSKIVNNVINSLIEQGFKREEIETINLNVYEDIRWEYDGKSSKRVPYGFKATHTIRIKFPTEDTDKIGKAIDAGIDNGAMLSYINFELSKELENKYKAEALESATQDARIKAEAMARGLNAKLGKVVSVNTYDFGYNPWIAYDNMATRSMEIDYAKVESSVQPRNQEISAQVSVVYQLK
jgi:uncharacterized protein